MNRRHILASLLTLVALLVCGHAAAQRVAIDSLIGEQWDAERKRAVMFRMRFPTSQISPLTPILLLPGSDGFSGQTQFAELGQDLARAGFLAVHVNHLRSDDAQISRRNRVLDAQLLLRVLRANQLPRPITLRAEVDASKVGIVGFGDGAQTAFAMAGADFGGGIAPTAGVTAIVAMAPEGPGQLLAPEERQTNDGPKTGPRVVADNGAFDRSDTDHSWRGVNAPVLSVIGAQSQDAVEPEGWRLVPFVRTPAQVPHVLLVAQGLSHGALAQAVVLGQRSLPIAQFVNAGVAEFFAATLPDSASARGLCGVGADLEQTVAIVRHRGVDCR